MRASYAAMLLVAAGCSTPEPAPGGLDLWLAPIHGETALILTPTKPGFY